MGESTVEKLAAPFEMSLPAISKHLKVLERGPDFACAQRAARRYRASSYDGLRSREVLLK
jgi:hypothetical protein